MKCYYNPFFGTPRICYNNELVKSTNSNFNNYKRYMRNFCRENSIYVEKSAFDDLKQMHVFSLNNIINSYMTE